MELGDAVWPRDRLLGSRRELDVWRARFEVSSFSMLILSLARFLYSHWPDVGTITGNGRSVDGCASTVSAPPVRERSTEAPRQAN